MAFIAIKSNSYNKYKIFEKVETFTKVYHVTTKVETRE